jgi:hypothetical protein
MHQIFPDFSVYYIFRYTDMIMERFGQKRNILILILSEKKKVKVSMLMLLGIRYYYYYRFIIYQYADPKIGTL